MWNSAENVFARSGSFREGGDDEEALRWAALERLPTYARVRRGIFRNVVGDTMEIDVGKLEAKEQKLLLDRLVRSADDDPEQFFDRMRRRFDAVALNFPKIEVRFQNLKVEAFVHVGSRALPTIPNFVFNMTEAIANIQGQRSKLTILDNISGIVRPSILTLLLGPPSSGKTTLLLALAGRLGTGLQMSGKVTYNGHGLKEFVPQRTSAYVSQQDWHAAEMTVKETLEFAGRCQGVGTKYGKLCEVISKKDQEQYWSNPDPPYRYVPPAKFVDADRLFEAGKTLSEELDVPFDKRYNHPAALATSLYGVKRCELLKTSFNWQLLLMKRNAFIYVFKFIQGWTYCGSGGIFLPGNYVPDWFEFVNEDKLVLVSTSDAAG